MMKKQIYQPIDFGSQQEGQVFSLKQLVIAAMIFSTFAFSLFYINSANATSCQADFSAYDSSCTGYMYFLDESIASSNIVNWSWSFGDGQNSSEQNPVHLYSTTGYYAVSLTIHTDDSCFSSWYDSIYVCNDNGSWNCNIVADFEVFDTTCQTKYFYSQSTGDIISYYWSFGDGTNSSVENPIHYYDHSGYYQVCLIAFGYDSTGNDSCYDQICKTIYVCDDNGGGNSNCNLNANFSAYDSSCTGYSYFFNNSSGNILNYVWSFGDGSYTYEENPIHYYTQTGYYNVCLTIYGQDSSGNDSCYDQICKQIYVCNNNNNGNICDINASFQYYSDSTPNSNYVCFQNTSTGNITFYVWDFGDGSYSYSQYPCHEYTASGSYEVCLTIWGNGIDTSTNDTCFDTYCTVIWVGDTLGVGPGRVKGRIIKGSGKSAEVGANDIQINLLNSNDKVIKIIYSNEEGNFDFKNLPYGTYKVYPKIVGKTTYPAIVTIDETNPSVENITMKIEGNNIVFSSIKENIEVFSGTQLFPNPVINSLNVNINSSYIKDALLNIYNQLGQTVYTQNIPELNDNTNIQLDIEHLPTGNYFLRITDNNGSQIASQFVKE